MSKFRVPFSVSCTVYVDVEADCEGEAIELAEGRVHLSPLGIHKNKIMSVGVSGLDIEVEPGDDFEVVRSLIQKF